MQEANRAWNSTLSANLAQGKTYRQSVKKAQREYDKVLRKYDRTHRINA